MRLKRSTSSADSPKTSASRAARQCADSAPSATAGHAHVQNPAQAASRPRVQHRYGECHVYRAALPPGRQRAQRMSRVSQASVVEPAPVDGKKPVRLAPAAPIATQITTISKSIIEILRSSFAGRAFPRQTIIAPRVTYKDTMPYPASSSVSTPKCLASNCGSGFDFSSKPVELHKCSDSRRIPLIR